MPSTGPKAKHWCFTLNNYTQADIDRLSMPINGTDYLIYGKEVGTSGTPHLQGTVCFQSRKRLQQVIETIGQAHCSVTRYLAQSIDYCKKDGDFLENGVVPAIAQGKGEGKRSDLEEFKASVKEGVTSEKELREIHSSVCASYPRFVKDYIDDNRETVQVMNTKTKTTKSIHNTTLIRRLFFLCFRLKLIPFVTGKPRYINA